MPPLTDPLHNPLLTAALARAERCVAGFYAIQPREWASRFRYDLASAADHPGLPFPHGTLAQIVQLEIASRPIRWRIVLNDPEILAWGKTADLELVLAYTLAHELVHLVRFASGLAEFAHAHEHSQQEEEDRVARIAREALAPIVAREDLETLDRLAGCAGSD